MIEGHDQGSVFRASEHAIQTNLLAAVTHGFLTSSPKFKIESLISGPNYPASERLSTNLISNVHLCRALRVSCNSATITSTPASRRPLTYFASVPESVTRTSMSVTGPT